MSAYCISETVITPLQNNSDSVKIITVSYISLWGLLPSCLHLYWGCSQLALLYRPGFQVFLEMKNISLPFIAIQVRLLCSWISCYPNTLKLSSTDLLPCISTLFYQGALRKMIQTSINSILSEIPARKKMESFLFSLMFLLPVHC